MRRFLSLCRWAGVAAAVGVIANTRAASPPSFDEAVAPVLTQSCVGCHNDRVASGSFDIRPLLGRESIHSRRDHWRHVLQRMRAGEMPPKESPAVPEAAIRAITAVIESEWEKADRNTEADPGRVTARRLNRAEYANTVRDLLGVEFQADKEFPVDDSGDGFDNIADVLSISSVLMEKYVAAAERIAARAVGADPLPKPVSVSYSANSDPKLKKYEESIPFSGGPARLRNPGNLQLTHRIDFDGEYVVRLGLAGQRGADAKPVTVGLRMDGKLLKTIEAAMTPPKETFFAPYSEEEIRLYLPEGDHTFEVSFIDDPFPATLDPDSVYAPRRNRYPHGITFVGPYAAKEQKPSRSKVLICDPISGRDCVTRIVANLSRRAYRRPVSREEVGALVSFVDTAQRLGLSVEQGIQTAIQAMLVSPHFLFRIERDTSPGIRRISDVELASRLSYFLWSSMPDDELLSLAEAGKLRATLGPQIKRMLADAKAGAFAENFAGQWLETRNLDVVKPDPQKFPDWTPELRDAMKEETRLFFQAVLQEKLSVADLLDARFTFLNETLARHYGIEGVKGSEFRKVHLSTDQRGGILGHASVLTVSSYPTRTSPVVRGRFILDNVLGTPPPPPPPDVPQIDEDAVGTAASLRTQLEKHRTDAVCASCHNRMDPLGFGLENYDAIGKWRTMDGKFPIDSSGTLPSGKGFANVSEFRKVLVDRQAEVARCLTEKMLTYALGRGLQTYDQRTVESIHAKIARTGYRFDSLIEEVVASLPFQYRRGEVKGVAKR